MINQRRIFIVIYIILLLALVIVIISKQNKINNEIVTTTSTETISQKETETTIKPTIEENTVENVENIEETEEETTTDKILTVYDVFTPEEIYLIQRCVETETYTADIDSKMNVVNVIFNRLRDGRFGETITEIITNKKQFAYWRTKISNETIIAIEQAWIEEDKTNGALYFHSGEKKESFNGASYIFTDDINHHFYK